MKNSIIEVIKIGNMVKISLMGKLHQKNCGTNKESDELFRVVLKAKQDPTEENINIVRGHLNERTRIAIMAGLENDPETGEVYLSGFNTPLPDALVEIIKEYHENGYPLNAIQNFWKLLMINPDVRVREVLFDFITTHDFVLTEKGYMVVYKAVDPVVKEQVDTTFAEFVSNRYLFVKKTWKTSPKRYVVYKGLEDNKFKITKAKTAEGWDEKDKEVEILGNLNDLFDALFTNVDETADNTLSPEYTDMHTGTMKIILGEPVKMDRKNCDANFRKDCSNGLHVGATSYVEHFANNTSTVLVCYVNPANVVAVPDYDHSKMRVSEYFPFAIATYDNNKIDVIEQSYFDSDYCTYEEEELNKQVEMLQKDELPIKKAKNAEEEERPMSELLKIIESRLVDLA